MSNKTDNRVNRYDLVSPMMPCREELLEGIDRLIRTGSYILGNECKMLEKEMAEAVECKDAIGVASGSAALYLALQLSGVGPGVEVITTPYTFVATIEAIIRLGGIPVFVDIRHEDLNIDHELIEQAITPNTKVIMPVHIFGMPCEMDTITAIAEKHGLDIIEDNCQAFGSLYHGKPCGSFSRMSALSFYPTKNLPGIGDGGMVFCKNQDDADLIRKLRGHQAVRINGILRAGWNSRIDEIQSLAIRIRLSRFKDEQADRDRAANIYNNLIPESNRLPVPSKESGNRVTHHQYWVRVDNRDKLAQTLSDANVDFGVYYDPALHQDELSEYCRVAGKMTEAEAAGSQVIAIPIHQALADSDAQRIGELVRDHIENA